ncbi:hypothetical protein EDD31_1353 [Bogoriella caseilytica]|uniref:Abi-like protein n=1 Tax=Bogoriella caseilytica TaxID=56055 RepID=A0A3N2BCM7_9MICO|nr:hypothetical protein EDD31_1353 [Bogoriella caseilytica]
MSTPTRPPGGTDWSYETLRDCLTHERLGSYLKASRNELSEAFALYEWNMEASASVLSLTSMTEVVVRNALDRELTAWAARKDADREWFDLAPLDSQGRQDLAKARDRATRRGKQPERHGKVIAELSLGFWRFLVEQRYFTSLWVPATHASFPGGPADLRARQRAVKNRLQQLTFVRNRAAHHEPIHRRDLLNDLRAAIDLAEWACPDAGAWTRATSTLAEVARKRPVTA